MIGQSDPRTTSVKCAKTLIRPERKLVRDRETRAGFVRTGAASGLCGRHLRLYASLRRDEDRTLSRRVCLLTMLGDVQPERLLPFCHAQRHEKPDDPQDHKRTDEGIRRARDGRQSLPAKLARVPVEKAIRSAVPR